MCGSVWVDGDRAELLDYQRAGVRERDAALQAVEPNVPALEGVVRAGNMVVDKERPHFGQRAGIDKVERVGHRRDKVVKAVVALERHAAAVALEKVADALWNPRHGLLGLVIESGAAAATAVGFDGAVVLLIAAGIGERTGWRRRRWRGRHGRCRGRISGVEVLGADNAGQACVILAQAGRLDSAHRLRRKQLHAKVCGRGRRALTGCQRISCA